ncbi:MAG: (d)CMP kinase, partial [Chlamydiota bacterium]
DAPAVDLLLNNFHFAVVEDEKGKHYFVDGRDVTEVIRSRFVTARVSAVSALPQVRSALLNIQHEFGAKQNAVFEGRDLGTVVFPQAEIKIFLTADPRVRAERRLNEIAAKNSQEAQGIDRNTILVDILERDRLDSSRELAPLRCPEGAFTIDTTQLSIDDVVESIVKYCATLYPQSI